MIKYLNSAILLIMVAMATSNASVEKQVVTVETKIGTINGYVKDTIFLDKTIPVDRFQGIPFAEAPIGERRFRKALPKVPLTEPLNAFQHGSMCVQSTFMERLFPGMEFNYSEDCLYLNVYAPHERNHDDKLAVMVWIYGGAFIAGFADSYLGDNIAAHGNVIVVTISYRLNAWGFLSTGNEHAPGNAGLWDQHMAIKWISENIGAFGGDNQRITIFGESAGSASVFYQALYPGNKGLFQRAIGQSGSVFSTWASNDNGPNFSRRLASHAGCPDDNSKEAIECLQSVPSERLLEIVSNASLGFFNIPLPFIPTKDGDFVTYDPKYAFYESSELSAEVVDMFNSVDILTGVNSAEGGGVAPFFGIMDMENWLPNCTEFEDLVEKTVAKFFKKDDNFQLLVDLIKAEYTDWVNPADPLRIRDKFVELHGDNFFAGPMYNTLNRHVQDSSTNTYMYVFDQVPSTPLFSDVTWLNGVAHAEELPFVFGFKSFSGDDGERNATEWEKILSRDIMSLWTNFAKSGNPNKPVNLDLDWLPYTQKHQHYLHITRELTSQSVKQRWHARGAYFWTDIVRKISEGDMWRKSDKNNDQSGTCDKDGACEP